MLKRKGLKMLQKGFIAQRKAVFWEWKMCFFWKRESAIAGLASFALCFGFWSYETKQNQNHCIRSWVRRAREQKMSKLRGRFSCVGQLAKSATNGRLWITKGLNWNIFYLLPIPWETGDEQWETEMRTKFSLPNGATTRWSRALIGSRGDQPNQPSFQGFFFKIFYGFFSAEINDWKRLNVFVHSHGRIDNAVAS